MIYILLTIITLILSSIYHITYKGNKNNFYKQNFTICIYKKKFRIISIGQIMTFLIMVLPVSLVAGLRYGISTDYIPIYERGFKRVLNGVTTDNFEPAFYFLIKMCGTFSDEAWPVFLVSSLITMALFFAGFKQSKIFLMSVTLLFAQGIYFDTFNGIRQYIVAAVFLCCIKYIRNGNLKRYMVIMGLCTLIHTSALITLPLYFLRKIKLNYYVYIVILTLMMIFKTKLFQLFLIVLSLNSKYYNNFIVKGTLLTYISPSVSQLVTSAIALIPMIYLYKKMHKTEEGKFFFNMAFLNLTFAVFSFFLPLMERVMYYTKVSFLLGIPFVCSLIRNKKYRFLICAVEIILLGFMNIYGMLNREWYAVLPYQSIFSK